MIKNRKGTTLIEIIVVIMIIAILAAASIAVGAKQVSKARIQDAMAYEQILDNEIEDAVSDMGFLEVFDVDDTTERTQIESYLGTMAEDYLNCTFDMSSLQKVLYGNYEGFRVTIATPYDSWEKNYMFFYFYNSVTDKYRLTIACSGPNNTWGEGYTNGYLTVNEDSGKLEDDIIDILVSR